MHTEFESSGDRYGVKIVAIQEWGTIWNKNRLPSDDDTYLKVGYYIVRSGGGAGCGRCGAGMSASWQLAAACGGMAMQLAYFGSSG